MRQRGRRRGCVGCVGVNKWLAETKDDVKGS